MAVPLLSAFYFGSVEHYRLLARHPRVIIDAGEHYERQSYRTRTAILGPNGKQDLVVPIARRSGEKMPLHTVGLSYAETWPQQHLHAIRSAYGQTPWAIHYIDAIEDVVLEKYDRLLDLDLATMRLVMGWLGLATELVITEEYMDAGLGSKVPGPRPDDPQALDLGPKTLDPTGELLDLRTLFHPKKALLPEVPASVPYTQVFADRHGFVPRLSIIDLVMNTGPDAARILHAPPAASAAR